jgi:hypothetical protein
VAQVREQITAVEKDVHTTNTQLVTLREAIRRDRFALDSESGAARLAVTAAQKQTCV